MTLAITARQSARNHRLHVLRCREILKPSEVRIGHVPAWLSKRIRERLEPRPTGRGCTLLLHALERTKCGDVFDHHGSTILRDGRPAYVSEPYLHPEQIEIAQRFAELLGLELSISANSWWSPGVTIRLIFTLPANNSLPTKSAAKTASVRK